MEMGGNFCQILELGGGTTIKGRKLRQKLLFLTRKRLQGRQSYHSLAST